MNTVIPISEVRANLPTLVDDVFKLSSQVSITVQGKVKAMLVSADEWISTQETMEILSDPETMKSLRQGIKEIENGETTPWEQVKEKLGL